MGQTRIFLHAGRELVRLAERAAEVEFEDDGFAIASFELDERAGLWEVALYCDSAVADEAMARWRNRTEEHDLELRRVDLPETDWVGQSLLGLRPVVAGRFLVHGSHDRGAAKPWQIAIEIDAGQAFGTGHHGTTAGCLIAIGAALKRRKFRRMLDLGTGSGVLVIALTKSLRREVLASDIDPTAVAVARNNVRINGVARYVDVRRAAGFHHRVIARRRPFDLIVANILARPLQALAPAFARHAGPGATVILSGLLASQARPVLATFRQAGFALRHAAILDGWATLTLENKSGGIP